MADAVLTQSQGVVGRCPPTFAPTMMHQAKHKTMKAIEYQQYGAPSVLQLSNLPIPTPQPNEVLIRVYATTVTAADIMMRKGEPKIGRLYLGLKAPKRKVLGFEFAGEITAIGDAVTQFAIGDRVFGGTTKLGCYGEYVCVQVSDVLTTMPANLSYEAAAPISGSAITVLNFLHGLAHIGAPQHVLINGASGGVGTYAVQLAKHFGATVTGVCSTANIALVKSLGADEVIDYTLEDFTKNGKKYDIIFDTVSKRSFSACKSSLSPKGVYLATVATLPLFLQMIWTGIVGGKQAKTSSTGLLPAKKRLEYLLELRELLRTEKITTIIDRRYALAEMAAAHAYVEAGHKKGSVVITV